MKLYLNKQTKRKKANAPLFSKNRALKVLRQCNQILFHAENEQQLLEEVCRIIVEGGEYCLAWVGYPETDEYKSIKPVAHCGYETGYLESLKLTWDDTERGHGPAGIAVRTAKSCVVRDIHVDPDFIPWREAAEERGYASVVAFPLFIDKELPAVILMYAAEPDAFDKDELELLENLSDSLAYGIVGIRVKEKRSQAEESLRKSEERFRHALDATSDGVWDWNVKTGEVFFSDKWCESLGYKPDEVDDNISFWKNILHPDDKEETLKAINDHFEGDTETYIIENRLRKKSGEYRHNLDRGRVFEWDEDGKPLRMIGTDTDITERKQAETSLKESEERFRAFVHNAPICIHDIDLEGRMISMNPSGLKMMNVTDESEIRGLPYLDVVSMKDRSYVAELMSKAFEGRVSTFEFEAVMEGISKYFSSNFTPIKNTAGQVKLLMGISTDITERKKAEEQLSHQASHDALTGLVNRREFERRAERLLLTVKQDKGEHALCFMDLDQFKVVNDTCGHTAGDEMLRQLTVVLQGAVRKRDTLARLGGDEFGVLMEHCSLDHALRVAKSLQKVVQDYQFSWEGHNFKVGISIGLITITEDTHDLTELLRDADAACYIAKDMGRNRIHVCHTEDSKIAKRHGEID